MMKYQIGQDVWRASWDAATSHVTCPDCGGTGRLRVTFHDETQVSIECRRCSKGYDPPSGMLVVYDRKAKAVLTTIIGVEIELGKTCWKTADCYRVDAGDLFDNEVDCLMCAELKAEAADKAERDRIQDKENDARSWAWNASYHRRLIKEAHEKIKYHTAKLAVAAIKAKEKDG